MQKPLDRWFFFWFGPAVFLILGLLAVDSYFHETDLRIPRGESKVPVYVYLRSGLLHMDVEATPDPHAEKTFALMRSPIKDRQFHVMSGLYQKSDIYKYQGATSQEKSAAKAAGLKSPLVVYEFTLPLSLLMAVVSGIWWFAVKKRSRRMANEAQAALSDCG